MLNFYVVFNSKVNVFFPNTEAIATVILQTDTFIKARKIDIKIIGRAKTEWHEYEYQNDYDGCNRTEFIPYGAEMLYLNSYAVLWASMDGTNMLPPGNYQFPFKFVIPANSPPNMSGEYGNVRYFVKANIDIPWAIDESRYMGFSVCPLIDLNLNGQLALPVVTGSTEMETKCCSCTSYPLTITVNLPKTGYVPGETVAVRVDLNNTTTSIVTSIELGITSSMVFTGHCEATIYMDIHGFDNKL
uniref:Arrestin-like N-terminal domain-containing protein n=1 Tax=Panagrolaimus sp. ES5 TaxID=591445 RepID=A0AC34EZD2_9BILA